VLFEAVVGVPLVRVGGLPNGSVSVRAQLASGVADMRVRARAPRETDVAKPCVPTETACRFADVIALVDIWRLVATVDAVVDIRRQMATVDAVKNPTPTSVLCLGLDRQRSSSSRPSA